MASKWKAPEGVFYASDNCKATTLPDITMWGPGYLILNARAHEYFSDVLEKSGEFLPVSISGDSYYMLNTLYLLPDEAMDKSEAVEAIELGVHIGTTNVKMDESKIQNALVFKSDFDKKVGLYCADNFREACLNISLYGLTFEPL